MVFNGCSAYRYYSLPVKKPPTKQIKPPIATTRPVKKQPKIRVPKQANIRRAAPKASPPAVLALQGQADSQRRGGELDSAVVTLERAIRIQPRNALLWHKMAEIRLQQHKPRLALDLAKKSDSLASGNRELNKKNAVIITESRRLLGQGSGVQ